MGRLAAAIFTNAPIHHCKVQTLVKIATPIGQVGCLALWCKAWPSDFNSAGVFSR